ncbi:MAG: arylmalonate decarboxylase [Pseudooceanicola sp.]|nr:arylmalonate decarboxylase [Pseudooceanicola sp.]
MTRAGLVVPPLKGRVPPDAALMYPGTAFLVEGIGVSAMTAAGYAEAEGRLSDCARALAERGAQGVLLFGTSLSFFRGPAFNAGLEARMAAASGLPSMTLTSALCRALRGLGARRLAVATAYDDAVNAMFAAYFEGEGFGIGAIEGLALTSLSDAETASEDAVATLSRRVVAATPGAEALVISCAGLTTAGVAPRLEAELGLPVVSSAMAGAWAAQGLAGGVAAVKGFGQVYEREFTR